MIGFSLRNLIGLEISKAGEAGDSIKPRVERRGTPGPKDSNRSEPAKRATVVLKIAEPMIHSRNKSFRMNGCRPLRGLTPRWVKSSLGLTPQALHFRQLRWLGAFVASFMLIICVVGSPAFSQSNQNSLPPTQPLSPADRSKYAVIISGASGEAAYAKQFEQWSAALRAALLGRFGFASDRVKLLTEKPVDSSAAPATAEEVRKMFAWLRSELNADSQLFLFLIGHGSFDKEAKFNLVGPDLSASDYNALLSMLPTQRVAVFNMASASGEFIRPLSARGRIIVTATRSGQENNATRFTEYFIAALTATDADMDQDGHISVLEAFTYANRLTAEFYTRAGRLATEHALLEDNGDGIGHQKVESGEGLLARATYLDSLSVEQAATNAAIARLMRDRTRLEGEIAQLIARKNTMAEAAYETELERLFIELAKVNRAIKQGAVSPTNE